MRKDAADIRQAVQHRTLTLPDKTELPVIGQGTWHMGEKPDQKEDEVRALQLGLDLGMTVIDTAEMYGSGGAEQIAGEAVQGRRDEAFIVSKVLPNNAGGSRLIQACEESLKRMGTEYVDLYLLHWRGGFSLEDTVEGMEKLKRDGKIRRWGVSNLDTADMQELWQNDNAASCQTNQVLYHLGSRGVEYDLLPWMRKNRLPMMAYCPLAQGGALRRRMLEHPRIQEIAEGHNASAMQILLAWVIQAGDILAIPKAMQTQHVYDNAEAARIHLTEEDCRTLDQAFPAPDRKQPLDIV
ncbi:aldo/keto reductase [Salibacterium halotolerans]|uniref:Aldo/keto reductase n=1 Tax=Salibacterium halotolerans TaxID=1884432 RepID=A0A1I5WQZ3_9BACI|nr:aldo/keto reductase [Salibacterium halotolerans]SFQ22159.1 Aldo/keto reductase [Salibacterium halotolerans]